MFSLNMVAELSGLVIYNNMRITAGRCVPVSENWVLLLSALVHLVLFNIE